MLFYNFWCAGEELHGVRVRGDVVSNSTWMFEKFHRRNLPGDTLRKQYRGYLLLQSGIEVESLMRDACLLEF